MFCNKILIAVDDSAPSQYAIDVALVIAKLDGCPVTFCVVLDPTLIDQSGFASVCELAEQVADELLKSAMARAAEAGVTANSTVLYKTLPHGIIDTAATEGAGMIAIGTHGRGAVARALMRSIADEIVEHSTIPLCVIRRPKIGRLTHRILVPFVDDELSEDASEYATSFAKAFGSELFFFTACDAVPRRKAEVMLDEVVARAEAHGVHAQGFIVDRARDVPDQIIKNATAMECDVIVMASHARSGFMRLVKGSVAEGVIRSSEMPVIVLRHEAFVTTTS
jgi:nucleotide-binding universal stress UspA family protein